MLQRHPVFKDEGKLWFTDSVLVFTKTIKKCVSWIKIKQKY